MTDLKARGLKEHDIKLGDEIFEPQAKRRVALGLLMDTLIKEKNIVASDDQVRAIVNIRPELRGPLRGGDDQDASRLKRPVPSCWKRTSWPGCWSMPR